MKDGLPVFSFEKHHSLQLVSDAAKESPFIYMGLFWDRDKAGWVGLWLSAEKALYFSGDIEKARQIFDEIKRMFWDFNTLEDISINSLQSYKNFEFEKTFSWEDDDGLRTFQFEDDSMSFLDGTSLISNSVDSLITLFSDNKKDEFWLGLTFNGNSYCCTGTEEKIRPLYKSLFNLYAIAEGLR